MTDQCANHPAREAITSCASCARSLSLVASPLSGLWTSTVLIACMMVVALTVPRLLHLPRWLEAEWVVLAWWAIWTFLLTLLLYRGWHISDDHVLALPRTIWNDNASSTRGSKLDWCDPTIGCSGGFGCGEAILAAAVVTGLVLASWFVVEFLVPSLFFLAYFLVRSSLARIANDRHDCQAHFAKALSWGLVWATLYALPLAAVIFVIHEFLRNGTPITDAQWP